MDPGASGTPPGGLRVFPGRLRQCLGDLRLGGLRPRLRLQLPRLLPGYLRRVPAGADTAGADTAAHHHLPAQLPGRPVRVPLPQPPGRRADHRDDGGRHAAAAVDADKSGGGIDPDSHRRAGPGLGGVLVLPADHAVRDSVRRPPRHRPRTPRRPGGGYRHRVPDQGGGVRGGGADRPVRRVRRAQRPGRVAGPAPGDALASLRAAAGQHLAQPDHGVFRVRRGDAAHVPHGVHGKP